MNDGSSVFEIENDAKTHITQTSASKGKDAVEFSISNGWV